MSEFIETLRVKYGAAIERDKSESRSLRLVEPDGSLGWIRVPVERVEELTDLTRENHLSRFEKAEKTSDKRMRMVLGRLREPARKQFRKQGFY